MRIVITDNCIDCGTCVAVCPGQALIQTEEGIWWNYKECDFCGDCEEVCPMQAIYREDFR
jgi:formate hydrogenlyase subunit 6/NADH:ubiquinone oxidoreductase subunit I